MKAFCENQHCDSPGAKVVPVSVEQPSDQRRTLCATCEEAYTWGVQHGTMAAQLKPVLPHLDRFLKKEGFVILVHNERDPSEHGPFEAWAYRGPLDLQAATPVAFGVGDSPLDCLEALDLKLADCGTGTGQASEAVTPKRSPRAVHPGILQVHDLLYLDELDGRQFYDPEKNWDADTVAMIAEIIAQYVPRPGAVPEGNVKGLPRESRQPVPAGLEVIVTVSGGVADVLFKPAGVAVALFDYDVEGSDEGDAGISKDPAGELCCIREWDSGEEVVGCRNWPIIKKAREGSYYRTWKCHDCSRTAQHSYEALAEVGIPICTNCDGEMELL